MKIGIINNLYPPFNRGGAEKIAYQQAQKLSQAGHQIFIITSKTLTQNIPTTTEEIYYFNSAYQNLAKIPKLFRLIWHVKQFFKPLFNQKIKKIFQQEKPDLIISHNLLGLGWRWPLIIKKLGIEHHHFLHDIQLLHPSGLLMVGREKIINSWFARVYQKILRNYFYSISQVISPSQWLLQLHQVKKFWPNIPTKIQPVELPVVNKINWPKKIKKILFVGQLEKHKGVLFLLTCAQKWTLANYDFQLTMIGNGSLSQLVMKVEQDNPQLKFLGRLESAEVKEVMKNQDCLIIPSTCHENSPTVIFEANQMLLPVIATNVGGLSELATEFNLKLFPASDQAALEKIIFQK